MTSWRHAEWPFARPRCQWNSATSALSSCITHPRLSMHQWSPISTPSYRIHKAYPHRGLLITGSFNQLPDNFLRLRNHMKQLVNVPTRSAAVLDKVVTNMRSLYSDAQVAAPVGMAYRAPPAPVPQWLRLWKTGGGETSGDGEERESDVCHGADVCPLGGPIPHEHLWAAVLCLPGHSPWTHQQTLFLGNSRWCWEGQALDYRAVQVCGERTKAWASSRIANYGRPWSKVSHVNRNLRISFYQR